MSSPKSAAKKQRTGKVRAPARVAAKPEAATPGDTSARALQLASELEQGLTSGRTDLVTEQSLQKLMAALCKIYSLEVQSGAQILPIRADGASPTDVMITASGLLKAADLQVFELGMWQSWTGR